MSASGSANYVLLTRLADEFAACPKSFPDTLSAPLSRNENELFRELKRNETEQSPLPISTRLCRLQSK